MPMHCSARSKQRASPMPSSNTANKSTTTSILMPAEDLFLRRAFFISNHQIFYNLSCNLGRDRHKPYSSQVQQQSMMMKTSRYPLPYHNPQYQRSGCNLDIPTQIHRPFPFRFRTQNNNKSCIFTPIATKTVLF